LRCEGYTKKSLALPKTHKIVKEGKWVQCENDAVMKITVIQDGESKTFPVCKDCYELTMEHNIPILATDIFEAFLEDTIELMKVIEG